MRYWKVASDDYEADDTEKQSVSTADGAFAPSSTTLMTILSIFLAVNGIWTLSLILESPRMLPPSVAELNHIWRQLSPYSPILDEIDVGLNTVIQDGRLRDNYTLYRQLPSPQVDAAWDRIACEGNEIIEVKAEHILRSGFQPADKARINQHIDSYPAQIEVFHLIHCLNVMRKEMFADYYFPSTILGDTRPNAHMRKDHVMYCVYLVLQNLMCHVDVSIAPSIWVPQSEIVGGGFQMIGDFNISKTCRNFEAVLAWASDHAISVEQDVVMEVPKDAKVYTSDGYW